MTSTPVNVGTLPNDGTGVPLRQAFGTVNANIAAHDTQIAAILSDLIVGMLVNESGHLIASYADGTAVDIGNVTGPIGITSATVNGAGRLILTRGDGTTVDAGSTVGPTGRGIVSGLLDGSRHLILTYTDGATADAGYVGVGVTGPVSSTVNNIPLFNTTDGSVVKDSGIAIGSGANNVPRLGSDAFVPNANLRVFAGDAGTGGIAGQVPPAAAGFGLGGRLLCADGTWRLNPQTQYSRITMIVGSQTWVAPANIRGRVTVIGAGGGGGAAKGNASVLAVGGGGGSMAIKYFGAQAGASFTAIIGASGAGVSATISPLTGGPGGNSVFSGGGLNIIANGGQAGTSTSSAAGLTTNLAGVLGGTATGGDINYQGGGSGAASISAARTGNSAAATGGGAVSYFGNVYTSGAASVAGTSAADACAASGGAGIGANSSDAFYNSTAGGYLCSGGSSANGTSQAAVANAITFGGPDVFGYYASSATKTNSSGTFGANNLLPDATYTIFNFSGRGGESSGGTVFVASPGDTGAGGGGAASNNTNSINLFAGSGGLFGGGGGAAQLISLASAGSGGVARNTGRAFGGGGGGAASTGSANGAVSGAGGQGLIIIEYDVVS